MGFKYGTTSGNLNQTISASDNNGSLSATLSGLTAGTTYYYKAFVTVSGTGDHSNQSETFYGEEYSFIPVGAVTTGDASNITASGATLSASYANVVTGTHAPQEIYFAYGTNNNNLNQYAYYNNGISTASGSFSVNIASLSDNTTYYYKVYMSVWNGTALQEISGSVRSFTTPQAVQQPQTPTGWLEMPSYTTAGMLGTTTSSLTDLYKVTHWATMGGTTQRNYTCLYDPEMYASYWVAYPLCSAHLGTGSLKNFTYDPDVPSAKQTNLTNGAYGVALITPNYENNVYSRGHQIPNADRNGVSAMQSQTYYITNMTPQIQNGFNSPLWSGLEDAVRAQTSYTDTVYVVTGAAFRKKGSSDTINTITNTHDGKVLPVPNYYWKVILKVTRSGGNITGAQAIGVWIPHEDLKNHSYTEYMYSVDQIEQWTGFDFFPNLPDQIETAAESSTSTSWFTNPSQSNNISGITGNNWGSF